MSRVASSSLILPPLPDEVWSTIFTLASSVPGSLDTRARDAFAYPAQTFLTEEQVQIQLERSMKVKRTIVSVCKTWNRVATSLLYRSIILTRQESVEALYRTLEEAKVKGHHIGKCTLRLDIAMKTGTPSERTVLYLSKVISHFENLVVFVTRRKALVLGSGGVHLPDSIILSLMQTCPGTLRVFDSSHSSDVLFYSLMNNAKLTRIAARVRSFNVEVNDAVFCPSLEYFVLRTGWNMPASLHGSFAHSLTSLTHIGLCHPYRATLQFFNSVLPTVGPQLRTFEVTMYYSGFVSLSEVMDNLIAVSCNLENLILNVYDWTYLREVAEAVSLAPVKNIGLRRHKYVSRRADYGNLFTILNGMALKFRTIQCIRFLDRQTSVDLGRNHSIVIRRWRPRLAALGVRLEDCDGNRLCCCCCSCPD